MASIHTTPADRVLGKLAEQASANTQIATNLLFKVTPEAKLHATEHQETARLFTLLHAAVADGLLDRLQDQAREAVSA